MTSLCQLFAGVLVLGGGLDLDDLGIALLADGERMNLEITEPATERDVFLDRDVLVAQEPAPCGRATLRSCSRVSPETSAISTPEISAPSVAVIGRTSIAMASPVR